MGGWRPNSLLSASVLCVAGGGARRGEAHPEASGRDQEFFAYRGPCGAGRLPKALG